MSNMRIRVKELMVGWCDIDLHINGKLISFHASYIGVNPIASLIENCADMKQAIDYDDVYEEEIKWVKEPGLMQIFTSLDKNQVVHFDIIDGNEDRQWHESVPFADYKQAVVDEGSRVLKALGLFGYHHAWNDEHLDFPLRSLLQLMCDKNWDDYGYGFSTWEEEKKALATLSDNIPIKGKKHFEECAIFYESWQIQCCGDPFSVGDRVEWTGVTPYEYPVADGVIIDFVEDHHDAAFLSIKGTVERIVAHRSEFPRGKRETNYYKAVIISEELQTADGHESEIPDDDTTERTFWGYVVTLKDVVVEPLAK